MAQGSEGKDTWNSRIGVILAVAGTAVGLGNFLRFPGQAAQFGGGAFMIAYFVSLLILGIPLGWMEWAAGRYGGKKGFYSAAGILNVLWNNPLAKYIGVFCMLSTLFLFTYYSYIGSWCLGYAMNFLTNSIHFETIEEASAFWQNFVGLGKNGSGLGFSLDKVGGFYLIALAVSFIVIYKGVSRGIERYCKLAFPTLIVIAFIVLARVLTLGGPDAEHPENNILNGLGFMWNPNKVYLEEKAPSGKWQRGAEVIGIESLKEHEALVQSQPDKYQLKRVMLWDQLQRPKLWLAAASQVFFSLTLGFGAVMVYASYTKPDDDLVLSSLSAISANEFAEVAIGGMISIPAAFAFLGATGVVGQAIFGLGFNVLPIVFSKMPLGNFFGFLFFFLLFLAAVSGVLSQLQTGIAFLEEALEIERKHAVTLIGAIMSLGCILVFWFSQDIKVMDTLDFWIGQCLIFTVTTTNILIFGWAWGVDNIYKEINQGAAIKVPHFFKFIIKFLCPVFLLTIFLLWIIFDVFGLGASGVDHHIVDLVGNGEQSPNPIAWLAISFVLILAIFMCLLASRVPRYLNYHKNLGSE